MLTFCITCIVNFHLLSLAQKKVFSEATTPIFSKIPVNSSCFGADKIYTKNCVFPDCSSLHKCSISF